MQSGRMRHRFHVEQTTITQNDTNDIVTEVITVAKIWGELRPVDLRESDVLTKSAIRPSHRLITRYRTDLPTSYTLVLQPDLRRFTNQGQVIIDERNTELHILLTEIPKAE